MVLFMARPAKRSGSSKDQFRKRVPADVLHVARGKRITFSLPKAHSGDERIVLSAKIGNEVMFSLRTEEASLIRLRHSAAAEQFERAIAAYREGPRKLLNKQIYGLAGVLYRDLNATFEDEPVSAAWWKIVRDVVNDAETGPLWPPLTIDEVTDKGARRRLANLERFVGPWIDPILSREVGEATLRRQDRSLPCAYPTNARRRMTRQRWGDTWPGISAPTHRSDFKRVWTRRRNGSHQRREPAIRAECWGATTLISSGGRPSKTSWRTMARWGFAFSRGNARGK